MSSSLWISAALAVILVSGCQETAEPVPSSSTDIVETAPAEVTTPTSNMDAVIASMTHVDRPESARENDALRKAQEVLVFADIQPGDAVFEMEAGDGYYTEIISRIVGDDGSLVLQNPAGFDAFLGPEVFETLLGPDGTRLPNVYHSKSNFDQLDADDESIDVVTWFLGPHELWYKGQAGDQDMGSPEGTYAEIVRILKPGGIFIALDHVAAAGSPETTGGTTHRIDPATVRARAEAAGLIFVTESDVLRNPNDKYDVMVFDPSVRRKTDRFLHKYAKPE